jgi:hypothetical protein
LPLNAFFSYYMLGTHALFRELTYPAALLQLVANLHFQLISLEWQTLAADVVPCHC